ncbi:ER degradation-enhancing alpha-mannosidase-like protein 3 isoform X1 [Amphibalanus amphitrite]|uniref:ER degradation-enhancing alpha-mannosidase-like protein 3 isoform X1 n=1 Tax=Amphibalanus amphitrite TaxID=1232801 RepID=UPI001C905A6C|nr:ER degradation-enhancing alpha-mannosidase-like protein 3 isoform X1 [Amphibalanus amphitrite]
MKRPFMNGEGHRALVKFLRLSVLIIVTINCSVSSAAETVTINATLPKTHSLFVSSMTAAEKHHLRDVAKEMFFHAYNAYMENAYPADELMPLSCKGRWRHTKPSRGDIDEALGNFSLTLVDSLDSLMVLGELDELEHAVRLVIRDVRLDADLVVSVFETNIRMLGGLLSGHILSEYARDRLGRMAWYQGELLDKAKELGLRLLPAFNTSTGIPHPRINLLHGMNVPQLTNSRETCTACAGTMILEFAALARLTGEPVFEEKAHRAMDSLWEQRHRGSDLVGTTINVHSGDWVRRDSGVGAGIDSYYEYCLKAYILLGEERYLKRFNRHYEAVMKYISQGPMLLDVHMHRPHTTTRNFMDALLAFWPGLQVLKGDVKSAIETHEMLYQVMQRHNFLPEAFTTDFQVHWGQHPLRPEFVESTYLLHRATGDPYYLHAGKRVLQSLQRLAWVPCGFAAVKDVRTGQHEDRLDSFVLAETFKYLYLLFADESDLVLDINDFVFSTEAHLFPLTLARLSNLTAVPLRPDGSPPPPEPDVEYARSCPNTDYLFPGTFSETIRRPLSNLVEATCPSRRLRPRRLTAAQFQSGLPEHVALVRQLGVTMTTLPDGRVQLLHTAANARSPADAEEGLLFMQEMIELSRQQLDQPENPPRAVTFRPGPGDETVTLPAGPAQFGPSLGDIPPVTGMLVEADPLRVCPDLSHPSRYRGRLVLMERGDCMFVDKARRIQALGAVGGVVVDHTGGTGAESSPLFAMSGDGTDDVTIPLVFLFTAEGERLRAALRDNPQLEVTLSDAQPAQTAPEPTGGVGHVMAVSPSGDELVQLVEDTAAATADSKTATTETGAEQEKEEKREKAERTEERTEGGDRSEAAAQVRAWLRQLLQLSGSELAALAEPSGGPLLREVASLSPERRAQLVDRLLALEHTSRGGGKREKEGTEQRLTGVLAGGPSGLADILRAGGVTEESASAQDAAVASAQDATKAELEEPGQCGASSKGENDSSAKEGESSSRDKDEL